MQNYQYNESHLEQMKLSNDIYINKLKKDAQSFVRYEQAYVILNKIIEHLNKLDNKQKYETQFILKTQLLSNILEPICLSFFDLTSKKNGLKEQKNQIKMNMLFEVKNILQNDYPNETEQFKNYQSLNDLMSDKYIKFFILSNKYEAIVSLFNKIKNIFENGTYNNLSDKKKNNFKNAYVNAIEIIQNAYQTIQKMNQKFLDDYSSNINNYVFPKELNFSEAHNTLETIGFMLNNIVKPIYEKYKTEANNYQQREIYLTKYNEHISNICLYYINIERMTAKKQPLNLMFKNTDKNIIEITF